MRGILRDQQDEMADKVKKVHGYNTPNNSKLNYKSNVNQFEVLSLTLDDHIKTELIKNKLKLTKHLNKDYDYGADKISDDQPQVFMQKKVDEYNNIIGFNHLRQSPVNRD